MSDTYVEWGVIWPDGFVEECRHESDARHIAHAYGVDSCGQVVRRTVTVESWEPAS